MEPLAEAVAAQLLKKAQQAAARAYVPYSKFPVGAALLLEDSRVVSGCNVENASFGLTLCAERTALVKALSEGLQGFKAIAIWAQQPEHNAVVPCGACRQVMTEFLSPKTPVIFYHPKDGSIIQMPLETLAPYSFSLAQQEA